MTLTGESADIILEKTLGLACLGHKTGECSLHVSPLRCGLFSEDLVVRHWLSVCLGEQQRYQAEFLSPSAPLRACLADGDLPSENMTCSLT